MSSTFLIICLWKQQIWMSWIISYKNLNLIEHHSFNLFSVIAPYGSLEIALIVWLNYPITFSRGKVYQNFQSFSRQKAWESEVRISAQCFMWWLISIDSTIRPRPTCHKGLWPCLWRSFSLRWGGPLWVTPSPSGNSKLNSPCSTFFQIVFILTTGKEIKLYPNSVTLDEKFLASIYFQGHNLILPYF